MTAPDLSTRGWRQSLSGGDGGTAVVGGRRVTQNEISGVLTLLPCVTEQELVDIRPQDRPYVAAEMTAFLLYWLSRLSLAMFSAPQLADAGLPFRTLLATGKMGSGRRESWNSERRPRAGERHATPKLKRSRMQIPLW